MRYSRRVHTGIVYKALKLPLRLVAVADSAYKATEALDECLALKGYLLMLVGSQESMTHYP